MIKTTMDQATALVILNYNSYQQTSELVSHVVKCAEILIIVIVDNCSTDNSLADLQQLANRLTNVVLVQCDTNLGYAAGNNVGIRYAEEHFAPDYLMIANPDVYFEEEVVSEAISVLDGNTLVQCGTVGLVAPRMASEALFRTSDAWKLPTKKDMYLYNFMALRKWLHVLEYPKEHFEEKYSLVDVLPGSLFICKADALRKVGYFDEDTFLYWEENILSYKLRENGYANVLMNHISYEHRHGTTINQEINSLKKRLELNYAGQVVYAKKCLSMSKFELAILHLAFQLGTFNYLLFKRIRSIIGHSHK